MQNLDHQSESEQISLLQDRMLAYEQRLLALETAYSQIISGSDATTFHHDAHQISAMEQRLTHELQPPSSHSEASFEPNPQAAPHAGGAPVGEVGYSGEVVLPDGRNVQYVWQRSADSIVQHHWEEAMESLTALAHPVRTRILKEMLCVPGQADVTVQYLLDQGLAQSQGALYHHVKALTQAGWVERLPQARLRIPANKIVALLALALAAEPSPKTTTQARTSDFE